MAKLALGRELLEATNVIEKQPSRYFHGEAYLAGEYSLLVFADSVYNFDSLRIAQLFKHTGALAGAGYAVVPKDLILGPGVGL